MRLEYLLAITRRSRRDDRRIEGRQLMNFFYDLCFANTSEKVRQQRRAGVALKEVGAVVDGRDTLPPRTHLQLVTATMHACSEGEYPAEDPRMDGGGVVEVAGGSYSPSQQINSTSMKLKTNVTLHKIMRSNRKYKYLRIFRWLFCCRG